MRKVAEIQMLEKGYKVIKIDGDSVSEYTKPTRDSLEEEKVELKKEGYGIYELHAEITVSKNDFDVLQNKSGGGWQHTRELPLSCLDESIEEYKHQGYKYL